MRSLHAFAIVCILAVPFGVSLVGCSDDAEPAPPGDAGGSITADGGATADSAPADAATTPEGGAKKPFG